MEIILDVKQISPDTFEIETIGQKCVYSDGDNQASKWVRKEVKGKKTHDVPQMSSSVGIKQKGRGRSILGSLGYMDSSGNNCYFNGIRVGLYSSVFSNANGLSVIPENFRKVIALFTARKSIKRDWINWQDEYLTPNTEHPEYEQWNNDAIVYSLFNSKSNQSSLRDVDYKDKKWDIVNNFFFMSVEEMKQLANEAGFNDMYQDAKSFGEERHVYKLLQETALSEDAKEVLEAARALVRKTMSLRETWYEEHLEYNLQAWDAGWAQLKPMMKEHFKEEYKEFVKMYKKFEDRMREGVYKFGFLKE